MTFLFAINPVSGGSDKTSWENGIRDFFAESPGEESPSVDAPSVDAPGQDTPSVDAPGQETPHQVHLFYLDGKTDEAVLRQQIAQHKPDCVVAVGGDGTIKLVAAALLGTTILLGALPAGSANGMARELGIPPDIKGSLSVLVNGEQRPMDVIIVNDGEICLHLADIGLNAQLVKHYEQNSLRGKFGYLRSVLNVLRKRRLLRVSITVGEENVQRAAFMVVLANARMYGTGAVINPDGSPFDGHFEVVIFRRLSFWEILKLFWRYKPFDPKQIEIFPATSVNIDTHRRAYFQVDGEYRGRVTTLKADIKPGALTMLVPK